VETEMNRKRVKRVHKQVLSGYNTMLHQIKSYIKHIKTCLNELQAGNNSIDAVNL
jgi:hypothetical protein